MFKNQRLDELLRLLETERYMTVPQLAQRLFVSEATARRDLAALEKEGLVLRSYGGVSLVGGNNRTVQFDLRAVEHAAEKQAIGRAAAARVQPGDALFLDGSSTVMSMIPFLQQPGLTVVTNSLRAAQQLQGRGLRVYMTGGEFLESSGVFVGSLAEQTARSLHLDKLFFSARGVSADGDISDYSEPEVALRRILLERSAQQYFLCDASKFGTRYLFRLCSVREVTAVLSDRAYEFACGCRAEAAQ